MSYKALYRKMRPLSFKEIVGQPHVVRALVNQLNSNQVSHAYLFCGTRGTGKTSAAKILARAVNCFAPQNGEPCNECEMCKNILTERSLDVAEIDAASNNGVENIRDLRDEVKYLPNDGRYKVYIIDEVHMLSTSAFNALLKTLEEPPPHVIFILATTDPQKIPATILSRCQRYDFRRISSVEITNALRKILNAENFPFEEASLDYIAYHSDGAMRDALSLLDQCINIDANELTSEKVRELLGAVDRQRLFEFTDALASADSGAVMSVIANAMEEGRDVSQFAADLIRHFRDVLVAGLTAGEEFSAELFDNLKQQSTRVPASLLMKYINAFSETLREMKFAPHMRTAFEVCALKMCMPETEAVAVAPKLKQAEREKEPKKEMPPFAPAPQTPALTANMKAADWQKILAKLAPPTRSLLAPCEAEMVNGMLKIYCGNETSKKLIEGKQKKIGEIVADYFKLTTPPNLAIEVREAYNKAIKSNAPPLPEPPPETEENIPNIPSDWENADFGQEIIDGEAF
ncbi:MAG: DNA polymerase III subunit gamma/tau [Clostridiales bacterium]|jgi:DNA polymerase-3 subunit gamma/tau|nr:DNA polymerase III subunit gamma/tau [Clostridiales bacterium]